MNIVPQTMDNTQYPDFTPYLDEITSWIEENLGDVSWGGDEGMALCPFHEDTNPSLSVNRRKGTWICHAGCGSGGLKALAAELGVDPPAFLTKKQQTYDYTDETGKLLFQVCRMVPKTFRQRQPCPKGGDCGEVNKKGRPVCWQDPDGRWWHWDLRGVRRVLYQLPVVLEAVKYGDIIFIPEGEKDVHNLTRLGLATTTNPGGAGKWRPEYSEYLVGADVVVLPDNDETGYKHARQVAQSLYGKAASIKVLELPGLPEKGDVSDWLAAGGTKEKLLELVQECPMWVPEIQEESESGKQQKETQARKLITSATDAGLFHTPDLVCYASIPVADHTETWPIKSKGFRHWLVRRFYEQEGKPPGSQGLQDALGLLEAHAQFDGPEVPVFIRLAELGGNVYLDLANDAWQAVEITPAGWRVIDNPPVKFRRARGMLPLPYPVAGGNIEELRQFVNVPDEASWRLLVAWLVATMRPTGPYSVLLLQGEQGSAKSTTARVLRKLVDPSKALLRAAPRDERDLAIAANNGWVVAFDNLSGIPPWLSDAICRLATGMGFSTRTLWENDDETIFDVMRPVTINGIDDLASRHDLLDRALVLNLPRLPEDRTRDETDFWHDFEQVQPRIMGALLDAVSVGLRNINSVKLGRLPRMADFAKWVVACEAALPWPTGGFLEAYTGNRQEAVEYALEGDQVATAVQVLLGREKGNAWEGTATGLLRALETCDVSEQVLRSKAWPKTAKDLSGQLRRAATFLRQTGIEVEFCREDSAARTRLIRISRQKCVQTVQCVQENPET